MKASLRSILTALGFVMLVGSIPWQLGLTILEASTMQVDLESHFMRMAVVKAFATDLPQALFDMVVGGGLIILCRIDQKLEIRA